MNQPLTPSPLQLTPSPNPFSTTSHSSRNERTSVKHRGPLTAALDKGKKTKWRSDLESHSPAYYSEPDSQSNSEDVSSVDTSGTDNKGCNKRLKNFFSHENPPPPL